MTDEYIPDTQQDRLVLIVKGGLIDSIHSICEVHVTKGATPKELEAVWRSWRKFVDDGARRNELEEYEAYTYVEDIEGKKARLWIRFLSIFEDEAKDLEDYCYGKSWKTNQGRKESNPTVFADPDPSSNPYHHMSLNFKLGRSYLLPPGYSTKHLHLNRRIHTALQANCIGRQLCITKRGFLALMPDKARVEDSIAIIHGASFPTILRQADEEEHHVLIGEAFIPRYTDRRGAGLARAEWNADMETYIRLC